jgi:hypothetical protein
MILELRAMIILIQSHCNLKNVLILVFRTALQVYRVKYGQLMIPIIRAT